MSEPKTIYGCSVKDYFRLYGAKMILEKLVRLDEELPNVLDVERRESIHDSRVASRRLRTGFTLFGTYISKQKSPVWLKELKRITRQLGSARDLDIQLEFLEDFSKQQTQTSENDAISIIYHDLLQKRLSRQEKLEKLVRKVQSSGILFSIREALQKIADKEIVPDPMCISDIETTIDEMIEFHRADLLSYEKFISDPLRIVELHKMRISAKHLRYTMEYFLPLYPKRLKKYVKAARDIQQRLGEIHDLDVWIEFLPEFLEHQRTIQDQMSKFHFSAYPLNAGISELIDTCRKLRDNHYREFLKFWNQMKQDNLWERVTVKPAGKRKKTSE